MGTFSCGFPSSETELLHMLHDTSELAAKKQIQQMQAVATSYKASTGLANKVEFWDWMNRNFNGNGGHMFASNQAMNAYVSSSSGKADWMYKQLQGKGYEWDWMQKQRSSIYNVFKVYNAGDVSNQAAIDVTEKNILTGVRKDYQMKAYISRNNPDLHNTGKDIAVVTNSEKVDIVRKNGYSAESFKNRQEIMSDVDARLKSIKNGSATPVYTFENVAGTMAQAGMVGCAFGIGTEAVFSYRRWKDHEITDDEYLDEILRSGGEAGTTAAVSTGIMIPISSSIAAAGVSSVVTIPVAFAITAGVDKIIAPVFCRGEYGKILAKAHYYQSIEQMYTGFLQSVSTASNEYENFASSYAAQDEHYQRIQNKDKLVTKALKDLYDSI